MINLANYQLSGLLQPSRRLSLLILVLTITLVSFLTTGCISSPAVTAEQRTFLDLSINYLGEYQLPKMEFEDTPVGGLSALTYDRQLDRFYALSDDRSQLAPARFYTLKLLLNSSATGELKLDKLEVADVTLLKKENSETFAQGRLDPEGIALSPKGTVFIASEGAINRGILPAIQEFNLQTGQQQQSVRIPERYLPNQNTTAEQTPRGIQNNRGFESVAIEPVSLAAASGDPYRLFTATESALLQDSLPPDSQQPIRLRLMHYLIGDVAPPLLVSEHLYLLDQAPSSAIVNGLTDLVTLDAAGHFLSLERTYGLLGGGAKIYQLATGGATDTSGISNLNVDISRIEPIKKKLLLDLKELGIYLDNLEGIALGPQLPDGSQSLLLVSDDNFKDYQVTQFLLFGLKSRR